MTETPRLRPGTRREVGLVGWTISSVSGLVGGTETPQLFLTLGRHRALFRGWLRFAGRLMPGGRLPRRETEMVIVRVAHRCDCAYELEHHLRLGRRAGLSRDQLDALQHDDATDPTDPTDPPDPTDETSAATTWTHWTPREAAMLAAVDALHDDHDLDDTTWERLAAHLDDREIIELLLLAGHYEMLATAITALRLVPDRPRSR